MAVDGGVSLKLVSDKEDQWIHDCWKVMRDDLVRYNCFDIYFFEWKWTGFPWRCNLLVSFSKMQYVLCSLISSS